MNNKLSNDYKEDLYNNVMNRKDNRNKILENVFCLLAVLLLFVGFNTWGILECKKHCLDMNIEDNNFVYLNDEKLNCNNAHVYKIELHSTDACC